MLLTKFFFFFFNDTATTEIYTLSLHDALPIYQRRRPDPSGPDNVVAVQALATDHDPVRSEEHTSELQSRLHLVCRLLLEKKKQSQLHGSDHPPAAAPVPVSNVASPHPDSSLAT